VQFSFIPIGLIIKAKPRYAQLFWLQANEGEESINLD